MSVFQVGHEDSRKEGGATRPGLGKAILVIRKEWIPGAGGSWQAHYNGQMEPQLLSPACSPLAPGWILFFVGFLQQGLL